MGHHRKGVGCGYSGVRRMPGCRLGALVALMALLALVAGPLDLHPLQTPKSCNRPVGERAGHVVARCRYHRRLGRGEVGVQPARGYQALLLRLPALVCGHHRSVELPESKSFRVTAPNRPRNGGRRCRAGYVGRIRRGALLPEDHDGGHETQHPAGEDG